MKKIFGLILVLVVLLSVSVCSAQFFSRELPTPPPEIIKVIEDVQTIYRLTIYYIYDDGTMAAPTYTSQMHAGDPYDVISPIITGYTASEDEIEGVMPARDLEFTVIYIPNGGRIIYVTHGDGDPDTPPAIVLHTIEEYETSLGLGASIMHLGICIE